MSKRKSSQISYEDAVANILRFVEEDDDANLLELESSDEEDNGYIVDDLGNDLNGNESEGEESEEGEEEQLERETQPSRKKLTRNRLVKSIDAELDMGNYDPITYLNCDGNWETFTGYLGPKSKPNTPTITWQSNIPLQGRQRRCDVINGQSSKLRGEARNVTSEVEAFDFFFSQEMTDLIVIKTNKRIDDRLAVSRENKHHLFESNKNPWLKNTDVLEIRTLLGLVYFRGLYNLNHYSIDHMFSKEMGIPIFTATMSKQRMKFLLSCITFDDPNERAERWRTDRFAAARPLYELFNSNCSKYYYPSEYLKIDETLYPMRHQIAFRQYNPNKLHRYGLLVKSLNDAELPFTYKTVPYAGKPEAGDGPYYIDSTENYVKYLVNETEKDISLKGRNISTDRLYTSIPFANWLLERDITTWDTR